MSETPSHVVDYHEGVAPPRPGEGPIVPNTIPTFRRWIIFGLAWLFWVGFLLMTVIAAPTTFGPYHYLTYFFGWFGGPVTGIILGTAKYFPIVHLGWLGMILMFADVVRPSKIMAVITIAGITLWILSGIISTYTGP